MNRSAHTDDSRSAHGAKGHPHPLSAVAALSSLPPTEQAASLPALLTGSQRPGVLGAGEPTPPLFMIVEPVDMRLGIDGLSACVQNRLNRTPCRGAIYLFSNARRNRMKLLLWDGTGVWLAQRRLHKGAFVWIANDNDKNNNASNGGNSSNNSGNTGDNATQNASTPNSHYHRLDPALWHALICGVDWRRLLADTRANAHWNVA